jgi:transposase-like protein
MAGGVAQFVPEVIDKIDADKVIDEAAEIFGVSPEIIRDGRQVQAIRQQRAEQQQTQEQALLAKEAVDADKTLSESERNQAEADQLRSEQ